MRDTLASSPSFTATFFLGRSARAVRVPARSCVCERASVCNCSGVLNLDGGSSCKRLAGFEDWEQDGGLQFVLPDHFLAEHISTYPAAPTLTQPLFLFPPRSLEGYLARLINLLDVCFLIAV